MPVSANDTLTFLFTDIEGSSRLWETHAAAMRVALARHDAVVRHCVEGQGGTVFKALGDAFCAVFPSPLSAVLAAVDAQRQVLTANAEESVEGPAVRLRVRMAIHTGDAQHRDGDYFGPALNRLSRLLSLAHGGQILISGAAQDSLGDALPAEVRLRALGLYRLRDFQRPERLYQILHPALPEAFPRLRALAGLAHNLPARGTSFVGRAREIQEIAALLERARLVTLTGTGGTGKSRLALEVATEGVGDRWESAWLIELAALQDPELVPAAAAAVFGVREEPGVAILQSLLDRLESSQCLIVLDNCEHLLAASARLTAEIVRRCPGVTILATSRAPLQVSGEQLFRVPSLALPPEQVPPDLQELDRFDSVRLFLDRLTASQPGFVLDAQSAPSVIRICRRLDGIPLALELAANRARAMSVEQLAARLDDRFRLLTRGDRTALPRQQTLGALIDWSYDLLSHQEQLLLERLAVFVGGWTLDAAEAVCPDPPTAPPAGLGPSREHVAATEPSASPRIQRREVLDLLTALVEQSLVLFDEREGTGRYSFLETIQAYAREKLSVSSWTPEAELQRRHAEYFLRVAEQGEAACEGAGYEAWHEQLDAELENLRGAMEFWRLQVHDAEGSVRFGAALGRYWSVRGQLREGMQYLQAVLARAAAQRTVSRARALRSAGHLAIQQHRTEAAEAYFVQAAEIFRALGDSAALAVTLNEMGTLVASRGNADLARALYEESLRIAEGLRDRSGVARALNNLANLARGRADYERARQLFERSLAICVEIDWKTGAAWRRLGLGNVACAQEDYRRARDYYSQALCTFRAVRDQPGVIFTLERIADLLRAEGRQVSAVRVLAAADRMREESGTLLPPGDRADYYDQLLVDCRRLLGEEAFECAWASGRALGNDRAVDLALQPPDSPVTDR